MNSVFSLVSVFALLVLAWPPATAQADARSYERRAMIRDIEQHVAETRHYLDKDYLDERVMQAMAKVPRHEFVPASQQDNAYLNQPLPIGHGQTISQPYIVALMTDLIESNASSKVLEIGTGSAYQAAILAELVDEVYTIEVIEALGTEARKRLQRLHYDNVQTRIGDGYYGWPEAAPFDAIIVTAAASHVPPPLIKQLKRGGRMVIPVGSRFLVQQLLLIEKRGDDSISTRQVLPVRFVPLTGKH